MAGPRDLDALLGVDVDDQQDMRALEPLDRRGVAVLSSGWNCRVQNVQLPINKPPWGDALDDVRDPVGPRSIRGPTLPWAVSREVAAQPLPNTTPASLFQLRLDVWPIIE